MFEYDKYPVPPVSTLQPSYPCSSNMYVVIVRSLYVFSCVLLYSAAEVHLLAPYSRHAQIRSLCCYICISTKHVHTSDKNSVRFSLLFIQHLSFLFVFKFLKSTVVSHTNHLYYHLPYLIIKWPDSRCDFNF